MPSQTNSLQHWTALIVIIFVTFVTFLFFHLYLRTPEPIDTTARLTQLEAPEITFISPKKGPDDAPVKIVEFGDYQCPSCLDMSGALAVLRIEFGDRVQHVWKDFPNEDLHANATAAAVAGRCAQQQGQFWNFHDALFTRQNRLGEDTYREIALDLDLNIPSFSQCFDRATTLPRIQADFEEGVRLGLTATPTVFIGDERFVGNVPIEDLRDAINAQLP